MARSGAFGIVTAGKSYLDVRQALDDLGITDEMAAEIGLSVYKVGMTWPLGKEGMRHFAEGLEEILVVEEKRAVIENQLKEQLYNWRADVRPQVIGKYDEEGEWILPSVNELTPARIARAIARRIARFHTSESIEEAPALPGWTRRQALSARKERPCDPHSLFLLRLPPQQLDQGARGQPGAGRHRLPLHGAVDGPGDRHLHADGRRRHHLGGPGAFLQDQAHVFVNLGDGTYFHSGLLAIRAAVAAGSTSPIRSSTTTPWP